MSQISQLLINSDAAEDWIPRSARQSRCSQKTAERLHITPIIPRIRITLASSHACRARGCCDRSYLVLANGLPWQISNTAVGRDKSCRCVSPFLQHLRPPSFRKIGPAARWPEVDRSISAIRRSCCCLSPHIPQQTSGAWTLISAQRLRQKMGRLSQPMPRATNHYCRSRSWASLEAIWPAYSSS